MLDFSWPELFFVAMLALVIIGPKDLPELFHIFGKLLKKLRRMYADIQGSMSQLQKEVNIVSGKAQPGDESWRELLPPELRSLPEDFTPGSMSAEAHQQRREQINLARQQAAESQPPTEDLNPGKNNE
ncbi:Sec-independent protein translocase subunit TatA/TatB [Salinimonas sediminis]|uniref:Twin-arginine translocase TatA/TatE family subunit n=1 Tax=Salinimonas sediminis TaxID=2303538 RepID=A0A346NPG6_9ALTE|nr:twin-arginine translocase TatA/TatE family subunit [Salinimonas sediminis]AXR07423.1 twin-arginine translocase TatA/TatE family subunit [Salinimonas sediminis]